MGRSRSEDPGTTCPAALLSGYTKLGPKARPNFLTTRVHPRQLAQQQDFWLLRRYRHPLLRGLEQAYRPALEDHVHRSPEMGPWVLINASWYKAAIQSPLSGADVIFRR